MNGKDSALCRTDRLRARTDFESIARVMIIQRAARAGRAGMPTLIDYLAEPSPVLANAAIKALFALVPMAALPERWPDDDSEVVGGNDQTPPWLDRLCKGWNGPGDFVDQCISKLLTLNHEAADRFLDRLPAFAGARRSLAKRLYRRGLTDQTQTFVRRVATVRRIQFPKQITFSPTLACQLKCDYCISAGLDAKTDNTAPFEHVRAVLDWAKDHGVSRVGLSGGEPTEHPEFTRMLHYICKLKLELFLATNGLGAPDTTEAAIAAKPLCVTMHLTHKVLGSGLLETYLQTARRLIEASVPVAMRCNFTSPDVEPSEYLRVALEAGISELRAAIPMPNAHRLNRYVDVSRLVDFGRLLASFVASGQQMGIRTRLSKPYPLCQLPEDTAKYLLATGSMAVNCPVQMQGFSHSITIHPDLTFSPCLGLSVKSDQDILHFHGPRDAARGYRAEVEAVMRQPLLEACARCPLWRGGRCVGGCLSYRLPTPMKTTSQ